MAHSRLPYCFERATLVLSLSICVAACSGSGPGSGTADGGRDGSHSGGSPAMGGKTGAGGAGNGGASVGAGGISGGTSGEGGKTGPGGAFGTGGRVAAGGSSGFGGTSGLGGATPTGGSTGLGGSSGTGGNNTSGGATGTGGGTGGGEYGFTYRPVQNNQLDWLCTLHAAADSTFVYIRLDQTGTQSVGIATVPVYTAVLAKTSADGTVTDLASAQYDYGGGHNNDSLQFAYQGKTYKYYHSSFGFGFRQCQPMDCVNIYPQGSTTLETEGCTSARKLPEVCVQIKADATHGPLVDTFKKCPGDSGS
jgi:hypothetical protein